MAQLCKGSDEKENRNCVRSAGRTTIALHHALDSRWRTDEEAKGSTKSPRGNRFVPEVWRKTRVRPASQGREPPAPLFWPHQAHELNNTYKSSNNHK